MKKILILIPILFITIFTFLLNTEQTYALDENDLPYTLAKYQLHGSFGNDYYYDSNGSIHGDGSYQKNIDYTTTFDNRRVYVKATYYQVNDFDSMITDKITSNFTINLPNNIYELSKYNNEFDFGFVYDTNELYFYIFHANETNDFYAYYESNRVVSNYFIPTKYYQTIRLNSEVMYNTLNTIYNEGVYHGYNTGYDKGYEHGTINVNPDYQDIYDYGYSEGYKQGDKDVRLEYQDEVNQQYEQGKLDGMQASQPEVYDAGFKAGQETGFSSNLHRWIVPAIIIVLILGGVLHFKSHGRWEE